MDSPRPAPSLLLNDAPNPPPSSFISDMDSTAGDESPSSPPPKPTSLPMPVREDCWSMEATETLIEAWGDRYVDLNKGNLRRVHWQEVADAVNAAHGHSKKTRRTDIQCKNRIDTIKKKYKIEKAKSLDSPSAYLSPWPFFTRVDSLIGNTAFKKFSASTPSPSPVLSASGGGRLLRRSTVPSSSSSPARALALTPYVPVGPRSIKPKRPAPMNDSFFRRTFAAAAAAASETEDEGGENEREEAETSRSSGGTANRRGDGGGCRQLAEAIMRFGEMYERVEGMKQEQLIELEKHRMEFAKGLEFQRIKLLIDTQLQFAKIKRIKPSSDAGEFALRALYAPLKMGTDLHGFM